MTKYNCKMNHFFKKYRKSVACIIFLTLLALDIVTKTWIFFYQDELFNNTLTYKKMYIAPFLDIVLVWNTGISFGFFNNTIYSNILFMIIASVIIGVFTLLLHQNIKTHYNNYANASYEYFGLIFIIAGGFGNLIDRFRFGAVLDFISIHYNDVYFPAFNCADSFITIGAVLMLIQIIYDFHASNKQDKR